MQMICALLVFGRPDLPQPLGRLSPWLDWLGEPREQLFDRLESQQHRRFIKTHTPLDGLPLDSRAIHIVVARDPLDAAVSMYHQGLNLDRRRMAELTGQPIPDPGSRATTPCLEDWLASWIDDDPEPADRLDSLPGFAHHLGDAWQRRHEPNVLLVRFEDLLTDLDGQMQVVAGTLGIETDPSTWPDLVDAATFDSMAVRADELAPDPAGIFKDRSRFFRSGRAGDGRRTVDADSLARYRKRMGTLAEADLVAWLDGDGG